MLAFYPNTQVSCSPCEFSFYTSRLEFVGEERQQRLRVFEINFRVKKLNKGTNGPCAMSR
jgi:hypothetical protein